MEKKITTNEQAWENLQRAKQNLGNAALAPKSENSEVVRLLMNMIDDVQYYLCPDKEQNEV